MGRGVMEQVVVRMVGVGVGGGRGRGGGGRGGGRGAGRGGYHVVVRYHVVLVCDRRAGGNAKERRGSGEDSHRLVGGRGGRRDLVPHQRESSACCLSGGQG